MNAPSKHLTKSLHTVTAVSRLARYLAEQHPADLPVHNAVTRALRVLGQPGPWPDDDPTVAAANKATTKLLENTHG